MPDWSYRTVFRPLLFRLAPAVARDLCLGVIGALGRSSAGSFVIDFLGHMRPDARLARTIRRVEFTTVVGLGCGIDVEAVALSGLARFGFGFVEVGPVTKRIRGDASHEVPRSTVVNADESIAAPYPPDNPGAEVLTARLERSPTPGVRRIARLMVTPEVSAREALDEIRLMTGALARHVSVLTIDPVGAGEVWDEVSSSQILEVALRGALEAGPGCEVWLVVPPELDPIEAEHRVRFAQAAGVTGVMVAGGIQDHGRSGWRRIGRPARGASIATVRLLRERFGADVAIAASGGVHEPADALDLLEAGADLVALDSGLVYSGPGLPKRVNDALIHAGRAPALAQGSSGWSTTAPR